MFFKNHKNNLKIVTIDHEKLKLIWTYFVPKTHELLFGPRKLMETHLDLFGPRKLMKTHLDKGKS